MKREKKKIKIRKPKCLEYISKREICRAPTKNTKQLSFVSMLFALMKTSSGTRGKNAGGINPNYSSNFVVKSQNVNRIGKHRIFLVKEL